MSRYREPPVCPVCHGIMDICDAMDPRSKYRALKCPACGHTNRLVDGGMENGGDITRTWWTKDKDPFNV